MIGTWWLVWMALMFFLLVPPIGYGWGYRGWGPPYPRYVQQRRGHLTAAAGVAPAFDHQAWGLAGDLVWMVFLSGLIWAALALWWR